MSTGRILEGAGCVTWWGFGPARDLLETCVPRPQGELNVLLVGSGDPRHILKTISGLKDTESLRVWVMENSMDVVARQLLLLYVSLRDPGSMGLQEKTEVFLELFGNSQVRSQTDTTLKQVAARLSAGVTDSLDTDTQTHPCLDTTLLKFKEQDELARIFTRWGRPASAPPCMSKLWDARVRQHLGTRYDARSGCFDWDLAMKLHDRGCAIIHKQQYGRWRESGVAFEMREGLYSVANQTLLSTRVFSRRGDRMGVRGYWGDIVSSPYLSFGVETEDEELLKTQNNQHVKTAQDVSVANMQKLFKSLSTRGHSHTSPAGEGSRTLPDESHAGEEQDLTSHQTELMNLRGVRVTFLSLDSLAKLSTKGRFCRLFNAVYCSASMVHHLDSTLRQTMAPDATLIVELARYLLDLSKEQEASFATKVSEIAKEAGFVAAHTRDDTAYAVFTLQQDG
ncbi:dynein axonemal assembly factor 3-like [Silurus meridionalis]|uniref:Dynein axonemal assembly factor 3 n=1 Tax=Silurus meridionalis TaxID=175797 RepID=A0A8T0BR47_SILME|nr:dynein axonemal assembly factor 3-like [Silurus meridionalis]KAF7708037.1 hypothetical protein HF521_017094 [Silurus meridionalis]